MAGIRLSINIQGGDIVSLLLRGNMKVIRNIIYIINVIASVIKRDRITVYAAQASFFVIISAIPAIMLITTFLQYFFPINIIDFSQTLSAVFPNEIAVFLAEIIESLFGRQYSTIIPTNIFLLLWSSSKGLKSIGSGLSNVYRIEIKNGYIKRSILYLLYTIVFIAIMVFSCIILLFGEYIYEILYIRLTIISNLIAFLLSIRNIIFLVILTLIFSFAYKFLIKNEYKFSSLFPGAIFSACGWLTFSLVYNIYIENFSNYSKIYGSLTAIVLLMLWIYICMTIFLLGAKINLILQGNRSSSK